MASNVTSRPFSPGAFLGTHPRLRAVISAVAATLGVWVVATVSGVDLSVPQGDVGPVAVVIVTLLAGLVAWGLLSFLELRTSRAWAIWLTIAVVVLIVSMLGPLGAETAGGKTVLSVMHAMTAAILITGFASTRRR